MLSASSESCNGISEQHQGVFLIAGDPGSGWLGNLLKSIVVDLAQVLLLWKRECYAVILDEEAPELELIIEKSALIAEEGESCELEGGRPGPRGRQGLDKRRPESI